MTIEFLNKEAFIKSLKDRVNQADAVLEKAAMQMGVQALNCIHPLTPKKSMTLDGSYHAEVRKIGPLRIELWVGSNGAFSYDGYNYVPIQEYVYHPHLRPGWHQAIPDMTATWEQACRSLVEGKK